MLISRGGTLVRTAVAQVSVLGRNTQGVRLMRLDEADLLVGLARVEHINGDDEGLAAEGLPEPAAPLPDDPAPN